MTTTNGSNVKELDVKKVNNLATIRDLRVYTLTPKEILDVVEKELPLCLVKLQGLVVKDGSFIRLIDTEGGAKVDLIFDEEKQNLIFNTLAEVEGILSYYKYVQGGGFYAKVNVKKFNALGDGESFQKLTWELEEKLRQKTYRGFNGYIQSCLSNGGYLQVAVLYGKGAQVHKDFEQALILNVGEYRKYVELDFYETSLNDKNLAETLEKVKDFSMVFVLRGGGAREELQKVGGYESAKVVIERNIPLYLAIGHTLDKGFLLEKVADYIFATPSIAGAELGKAVAQTYEFSYLKRKQDEYLNEISRLKAILEESEVGGLKEKIAKLQYRAQRNNRMFIIMVIINLILLWILISR